MRGELLKLAIRVAQRTVQQDMRPAHEPQPTAQKPASQSWSTFLHKHASPSGACALLPVYDVFLRPLFIFFIMELNTRRVVYVRATRTPRDEGMARQLREATP